MAGLRERLQSVRPLAHLMVALTAHFMSMVILLPALTDVTLAALCPGQNECSRAIFLSGFQQVAIGIGTMLVTPILGSLSDDYGRKPLLMIPFTAAILPAAVLAYSRERAFVYTYIVLRTLVSVVSEGSTTCLALAYVADTVEERLRAPAFGFMMGSLSAGFVLGTVLARWLSEDHVFKVAVLLAGIAALYLKLFLVETNPRVAILAGLGNSEEIVPPTQAWRPMLMRSSSSIQETAHLVQSSKVLTQVTLVAFISSLGEAGLQSSLLYYLKATFNFGKDQFADLLLIAGGASVIAQMVLLPLLMHLVGEQKVLCLGLFASAIHAFLYGIAWAPWVPYVAAFTGVMFVFVAPCIGSMVSKSALPEEQGKLQGFVSGVRSCGNIIAPLVISPLTAVFLSEKAPFYCPGFSLICVAVTMMVAFSLGFMLPPMGPPLSSFKPSHYVQVVPTEGKNEHAYSCS